VDLNLKNKIRELVKGEVWDDEKTLLEYSTDASLLVVKPALVIWPQNSEDIKNLVKFVAENKREHPELSLTVRAAGSCMSGGSLNESIILDVSKHFNKFSVYADKQMAEVEPGVFYRDFEVETLQANLILPCYTASKNLCALGGMIGNNAAGEKTLSYGKMENYVEELTVILRDGEEHVFRTIPRAEALKKSHEHGLEGEIYQYLMSLLDHNREIIAEEKPKVSKNSAGYYLWNIERSGSFDISKLLVGSQGTLGFVTKAKIKLVPIKKYSKLFVIFLKDLKKLGTVVDAILEHNPTSVESYDNTTFKLAVRFFPEILGLMKIKNILKLLWSFLPEVGMVFMGGLPKLILLAEFAGNSISEIDEKMKKLDESIKPFNLKTRITKNMEEAEKYWTIRRESFNLLRKHIRGKRTAPFIDDICVRPEFLPEFLPRLEKILNEYKLIFTIAGHAGNGNFHVIPLMDMRREEERKLVPIISDRVYDLVKVYKGTITAEHNDGLIRTPYLNKMFSEKMLSLFSETKKIFDPQNIFNPNKKVGGSIEYTTNHIAKS